MRDWTVYVRDRLPLDSLSPERAERIVRELAGQLAEFHADALARGLSESDADRHVRAQVPDWSQLAEAVTYADRPHVQSRLDRAIDRVEVTAQREFSGGAMLFAAHTLRDARHAVRQLIRTPVFTIVAVLTIALGVGATSAVFSVVNGVLLRPLPYRDPAALVRVHEIVPDAGQFLVAPATFLDWRTQNGIFERLIAYAMPAETLTGPGDPERVQGAIVSWDTFDALGVAPALGAAFSANHDGPQGPKVMVISHRLWQRRFGSDPAVVGRTVTVSGMPVTVLGVMPADFYFPNRVTDLWRPIAINPANAPRGAHYLSVIGRLKPGATREQADTEMKAISDRLARQYPQNSANESAVVVTLLESIVGPVKRLLLTLLAAVGVVLAIACVNVANLLLVRASVRQRELAVRSALGAGRRRLAAQMIAESLVLAGVGGALGLAVAYVAIAPLQRLGVGSVPRLGDIRIDGQVVLFTLAASLLTGLLFGLAPAWHASSTRLSGILRDAGRWSSGGRGRWVRRSLLVVEVALSIVLVVGAMLLVRSFSKLANVDPGFQPDHVLAFQVATPPARYPEEANRIAFFNGLFERLALQPGVRSAGMIQTLPLRGSYSLSFQIMSRPLVRESDQPSANHRVVSPGYFSAMQIPLKRGRWFTAEDTDTSPKVAVVDESFVRRHFPDEEAIGQQIDIGNNTEGAYEIVGIVGDVRHGTLDAASGPTMYVPYAQDVFSSMWVVVRSDGDPDAMAGTVKQVLHDLDPQVPAFTMSALETIVSESVGPQRFAMLLAVIFGGVALLVAGVGLYGVIAYSVSQRTREIGVRVAMGATRGDVIGLVVGGGLKLAAIGIVVGLASAAALAGLMSSLLFGVTSLDPPSYAATAALLLVVTVAACYVPARRAARVDPVVALAAE